MNGFVVNDDSKVQDKRGRRNGVRVAGPILQVVDLFRRVSGQEAGGQVAVLSFRQLPLE
jgi:hypothetical protein